MEEDSEKRYINAQAASEGLEHFRRMRKLKKRLDSIIEKKEKQEVIAHSMVLTAQFPALQRLVEESPKARLNWKRFSFEVVGAAVGYAYSGKINLT